MSLVQSDPEFRTCLEALYLARNLGAVDPVIFFASREPAVVLTSSQRCRGLLLALEMWAAHFGHPHPAIAHLQAQRRSGPVWRYATNSARALRTLAWLQQSAWEPEFRADICCLQPRLAALAGEHARPPDAAA